MKKVCKECRSEFLPKHPREEYCSPSCRREAHLATKRASERNRRFRQSIGRATQLVEHRLRESALRVADGSHRLDRAAVVYAVETRHDGTCVIEWRGTVPAHLRFIHGQGDM